MDSAVSVYIAKQKSPQKEICTKLREIIFETFPDIKEEMKVGVPYYEDVVYIVALKDHVNIGFSIEKLSEDEIKELAGAGKTVRVIEIKSIKDIDEEKIVKYLKLVR